MCLHKIEQVSIALLQHIVTFGYKAEMQFINYVGRIPATIVLCSMNKLNTSTMISNFSPSTTQLKWKSLINPK